VEASTRLAHAKKFLEVADLVAGEEKDPAYASVAAALADLAGIAASDAACCAAIGRRSRGQDHHDAEELLNQVMPGGADAANALRRLLNLKDTAHYGLIHISRADLRAVLRQARQLVEFATTRTRA
jgi:hypothetical protein